MCSSNFITCIPFYLKHFWDPLIKSIFQDNSDNDTILCMPVPKYYHILSHLPYLFGHYKTSTIKEMDLDKTSA